MKYRFREPIVKSRASNYGSNYYIFNSRKLGRNVTVFSNLEYDNIISLEMDYQVEWYCERPIKDEYYIDGQKHSFSPSVYVKNRDGSEHFQIVQSEENDLNNIHMNWAAQHNENVVFLTPEDIYKGAFLSRNLSYLASCSRHNHSIDKGADANIIRYIQATGLVTVGQLVNAGIITAGGFSYLGDLYFRGLIDFVDIANSTISYRTEVKVYGK